MQRAGKSALANKPLEASERETPRQALEVRHAHSYTRPSLCLLCPPPALTGPRRNLCKNKSKTLRARNTHTDPRERERKASSERCLLYFTVAAVFSWLFADRKRAGEKTSRGAQRDSSLGSAFYDTAFHIHAFLSGQRGNRVQLRERRFCVACKLFRSLI